MLSRLAALALLVSVPLFADGENPSPSDDSSAAHSWDNAVPCHIVVLGIAKATTDGRDLPSARGFLAELESELEVTRHVEVINAQPVGYGSAVYWKNPASNEVAASEPTTLRGWDVSAPLVLMRQVLRGEAYPYDASAKSISAVFLHGEGAVHRMEFLRSQIAKGRDKDWTPSYSEALRLKTSGFRTLIGGGALFIVSAGVMGFSLKAGIATAGAALAVDFIGAQTMARADRALHRVDVLAFLDRAIGSKPGDRGMLTFATEEKRYLLAYLVSGTQQAPTYTFAIVTSPTFRTSWSEPMWNM